jgi:hypothetical protein
MNIRPFLQELNQKILLVVIVDTNVALENIPLTSISLKALAHGISPPRATIYLSCGSSCCVYFQDKFREIKIVNGVDASLNVPVCSVVQVLPMTPFYDYVKRFDTRTHAWSMFQETNQDL